MMDYEDLDGYRQIDLMEIAKRFNVDPRALWKCYLEVMESNFRQDLWDIANENAEELRKQEEK